MSDISSFWNADKIHADWRLSEGGLATGSDLQTAVIDSLFTDRLARKDDAWEGTDRRGWWGDSTETEQMGSRLWLLRREKLTTRIALRAEEFANEALQWLVDDSVVASITSTAEIIWPNRLNLIIRYSLPGNSQEEMKFFWIWEQVKNAV